MKKTSQIRIGKTLFTIEEDAYAALDTYLASVQAHFAETSGKEEIIEDIEARLAEQFHEEKESAITLPTVERVIAQMGSADDFGDEDGAARPPLRRRLYRDPGTSLLAGVCSGLAAYLGLNVVLMRVVFVLFTLLNGIGILIYAVLWLTIPEAKTASQRLEMSGEPVTLATIRERAAKGLDETRRWRIGAPIARIIALGIVLIRYAIGIGLVLVAIGGAVALFVTGGFLISDTSWLTADVPMSALLPGAEYWVVLSAGFLAALIPLFFMLVAGSTLLLKRVTLAMRALLALLGIWFIALVICGFGLAETVTHYQRYVAEAPELQTVSQPIAFDGAFSAVSIEDRVRLEIVLGTSTEPSLVETGRAKDMGGYAAYVEDGTLHVTSQPIEREDCLLCGGAHPSVVLTVPSLPAIEARDSASVRSEAFPASQSLSVTLDQNAYADLRVDVAELNVSVSGDSNAYLSGDADNATIEATSGSYVDASGLQARTATVSATRNSYAEAYATESLEAAAQKDSTIRYFGDADVSKDADESSDIAEAE